MADPQAIGPDLPAWFDPARYPFEHRWLDLPEGRVHYVDEGPDSDGPEGSDRPTLVLVHGNPTWSFLYRHLVAGLSDEYRCVAPDLLGFGLSETPREFSHSPAAHARTLERFVSALGVRDAVFVVHDWGGPIALDYATRHPDDVAGLVATNTWLWPRDRLRDRVVGRAVGSRLGRYLVVRHNAFGRVAVAPAVLRHGADAPAVYRHYVGPLSSPADRRGSWVLAREVVASREWLARLWDRRGAVAGTPAVLLWGPDDPIHGWMLRRWRSVFPDAAGTVYDGVGHFVPEEVGRDLVRPVRAFLGSLDRR